MSLSDLGDAELAAVMADLGALHQAGKQHMPFGPRFIQLRRLTEARLHELFTAAGGLPERPAPHYFVRGDSPWYQGLAENMHRVRLPLSALPASQTSITCPDSFTAMEQGNSSGIRQEPKPHHGRVSFSTNSPRSSSATGSPIPSGTASTRNGPRGPRRPTSRSSSGATSPSGTACPSRTGPAARPCRGQASQPDSSHATAPSPGPGSLDPNPSGAKQPGIGSKPRRQTGPEQTRNDHQGAKTTYPGGAGSSSLNHSTAEAITPPSNRSGRPAMPIYPSGQFPPRVAPSEGERSVSCAAASLTDRNRLHTLHL